MTFTQLAAVIASLMIAVTGFQVSAETEVNADFQDAVVENSVDSTAKTIQKDIEKNKNAQGGVIILNSNSNDNKNDSAAAADTDVTAVADTDVKSEAASQADLMRSLRKSAEDSTEQRIVEKLEASRLNDERRRADTLFGDRFEDLNKKDHDRRNDRDEDDGADNTVIVKKVVVKEDPTPVIAEPLPPAPVVQKETVVIQPPQEIRNDRAYIGLSVGGMSYDASNVESNYAAGVTLGKQLENNVSVEASFLYSNHYVDKKFWYVPLYSDLTQYDIGFNAKYSFFTGALRPYIGAGITYVYRNYQDRIYTPYTNSSVEFGEEANTHAVDGNLMVGLDFQLSRSLAIGAEYKYSGNVFVKNDEPVFAQQWARPTNGKPLEEIDRSQVTVNAKFMF